jgi:hypothetical protein
LCAPALTVAVTFPLTHPCLNNCPQCKLLLRSQTLVADLSSRCKLQQTVLDSNRVVYVSSTACHAVLRIGAAVPAGTCCFPPLFTNPAHSVQHLRVSNMKVAAAMAALLLLCTPAALGRKLLQDTSVSDFGCCSSCPGRSLAAACVKCLCSGRLVSSYKLPMLEPALGSRQIQQIGLISRQRLVSLQTALTRFRPRPAAGQFGTTSFSQFASCCCAELHERG